MEISYWFHSIFLERKIQNEDKEDNDDNMPYSTDSYFHPLVFVFVSCISWLISKLQIWTNTAGKSANENSDNNDNEDTGHISDNFYFLFFVCFEGFPE